MASIVLVMDIAAVLPRIRVDELPLYDYERDSVGGFLNKKASQNSSFSKGKWQKRYFAIRHDIRGIENYSLAYFYSPSDKYSRAVYELKKTAVTLSGGLTFTLEFEDGSTLTLQAESQDNMQKWVESLEKVITVANTRERLINDKKFNSKSIGSNDFSGEDEDWHDQEEKPIASTAFRFNEKKLPTVRLDIDIESIPPSTAQRRQFVESFINDVAKVLRINKRTIEVNAIKPHFNRPNMIVVEFEINLFKDPRNQKVVEEDMNEDEIEEFENQVLQQRKKMLWKLNEMVVDISSPLYNGKVTNKLDPSFAKYLSDDLAKEDEIFELYSSDSEIMKILNRYKDVEIGPSFVDITHFTIYLSFEGFMREFKVPNPLALPRRDCAIYPYEVKKCLGLIGTLQELWIEPVALIPKDMPKALSQPIIFEPSARLDGAVIIHASKLKSDLTYEVQCEDYRGEVVSSLTDEEMDSIKDIFDEYDANGDGCISRAEMEELIRARTESRLQLVDERFEETLDDPEVTQEEVIRAEEIKQQHHQHIEESRIKMIQMFDAADVNGDGMLSFTEFMLMEAWWMRCTLNPERAHLF